MTEQEMQAMVGKLTDQLSRARRANAQVRGDIDYCITQMGNVRHWAEHVASELRRIYEQLDRDIGSDANEGEPT